MESRQISRLNSQYRTGERASSPIRAPGLSAEPLCRVASWGPPTSLSELEPGGPSLRVSLSAQEISARQANANETPEQGGRGRPRDEANTF